MTLIPGDSQAVRWLMTPEAVRRRCGMVLAAGEADDLEHFALQLDRLDPAADYVIDTIRRNYPTLEIPYHSRWRHFSVGGRDRWAALAAQGVGDAAERARVRFDLAVVSVLLDAGAGDQWRYADPESGEVYARSEGLAVASLRMFADGLFSADAAAPLRADATALSELGEAALAAAFQASPENPLAGLAGRAELLRRLGRAVMSDPAHFGRDRPRVGNLFDHLAAAASDDGLAAGDILAAVLEGLGPIWPGRITLDGVNLGDTWRHPAARAEGPTDRLVPFHKLSQWLSYSLIEPLQEAGLVVTGLDDLTALAEYRNGGLLLDMDVLRPKHSGVTDQVHAPGSEVIVEWRALTVPLIERLAGRVRDKLGLDPVSLPLAKVLEGGTWAAGRRIAAEKRPGGAPPVGIVSDGSVF